MPYEQIMNAGRPGCVLLLVDQSGSMAETMVDGRSKAEMCADAINRVLDELCYLCVTGAVVSHKLDVGVIGYGGESDGDDHRVAPILEGNLAGKVLVPITDIDRYPVARVDRKEADGFVEGGVWVRARASGGTPMNRAFELAARVAEDWKGRNKHSFPPVVINVTDGKPTCDHEPRSPTDPLYPVAHAAAVNLRSVHTSDGPLLLFNAHVSTGAHAQLQFCNDESALPSNEARFLFRISSVLPRPMAERAEMDGYNVHRDARGFLFNGNAAGLALLLTIGSTGPALVR